MDTGYLPETYLNVTLMSIVRFNGRRYRLAPDLPGIKHLQQSDHHKELLCLYILEIKPNEKC